jgi:hypothetical protein
MLTRRSPSKDSHSNIREIRRTCPITPGVSQMEESAKHFGTRLVDSFRDEHNFIPGVGDGPFGPTATHALAGYEPFELTFRSLREAPPDAVGHWLKASSSEWISGQRLTRLPRCGLGGRDASLE